VSRTGGSATRDARTPLGGGTRADARPAVAASRGVSPPYAAGSVIAVLPAILLFVVLQRFIVGAFVAGALKG
jgi:ABC-type glycerol-3-phosphate transport system permease component